MKTPVPFLCACIALTALATGRAAEPARPAYAPQPGAPPPGAGYVLPDGSIQIIGYDDMAGIVGRLDALFGQTHPGVRFTVRTGNNASAFSALTFGATALAPMGAEATASGLYGHVKLLGAEPLAIRVAHGSLTPAAKVSPLAVIVNPANPLAVLGTSQVTRIFAMGAARGDFSHWSQLGEMGDLAPCDIHPCGLPESDYLRSEDTDFGAFMVLKKMDGLHFTPSYETLPNYAAVAKRVATDPQAIGLIALNRVTPKVKVVALRAGGWSASERGTAEEITAGGYPYDRYLYIYVRLVPGEPFDPFVREYLRLALSREGQAAIARESRGYLPLNPREVLEELAKLR